jgi:hypothetical protein
VASVRIAFTLTPEEFAEGYRALLLRSWWMRIGLLLVALFSVNQLLVVVTRPEEAVTVIVALVLIWGLCIYLFFLRPRVRYRRQLRARAPQRHEFTDNGVSSEVHEAEIHQSWAYYREARETRRLYLLFTDQPSANMVPKRALDDKEDQAFRELVTRHTRVRLRARARSEN